MTRHKSGEYPPIEGDTTRIQRAVTKTTVELLTHLDEKIDEVLKRLAEGDTKMALTDHRMASIERIVYGGCALVLIAVAGGIIALVVK